MAKRKATPEDILNAEIQIDEQFNNYSLKFPSGSLREISITQAAQLMLAQEQLKQRQNPLIK